jgi:hypothetical protein
MLAQKRVRSNKSEVPAMFCCYKALKEQPHEGRTMQQFHSDGRGEYHGHEFQLELAEDGIAFTYSTSASQQQDGAAEQLNQTILNKAHSIPLLVNFGNCGTPCHLSFLAT